MESLLAYTDLLHLTLLVISLSIIVFVIFYIVFVFADKMHSKVYKIDYVNGKIVDYSDTVCTYTILVEINAEDNKNLIYGENGSIKKTFILNKNNVKISENLLLGYYVTLKSTEYEDGFKYYEMAYKDIR